MRSLYIAQDSARQRCCPGFPVLLLANVSMCGQRTSSRFFSLSGRGPGMERKWQCKLEHRMSGGGAIDLNTASVVFHDLLNNRQAQACAIFFSKADKRFKQPITNRFGNAGTV